MNKICSGKLGGLNYITGVRMFFSRNMSIRNKFLTAIVVLFIASLAFSVTILLAMKDISKMEERAALEGRLLNEVKSIEALHLQWNIGVANMLLDSSDSPRRSMRLISVVL